MLKVKFNKILKFTAYLKKYTYLIFSGLKNRPTYQNKTKNVKIFNTNILNILNKTNIFNTLK